MGPPSSQDHPGNITGARIADAQIREAHRKARQFIEQEGQFHLGFLPTEQSNPKTAGLAEAAQEDLAAAIRMLQSVDRDIPGKVAPVFTRPEFRRLVDAMRRAMEGRGRICFSGCGSTGRLSILLEAAWRQFWRDLPGRHPAISAKLPPLEDRVISIMTGGDFALVRSVPSFEDVASFGRRQVQEAGLGAGDVLVAITEGGETSTVIGSVWQALDDGAEAFFVFNNPAEVLAGHIERSRRVIEDARVTKLDLDCGAMAVAGSTRMQATTSELLVIGAALEVALVEMLRTRLDPDDFARLGIPARRHADYVPLFADLLRDLEERACTEAIASLASFEAGLYRHQGLVTYMADECLLDIFTDTTERSPTFMLPPFRRDDDTISPAPWAFVKNPRVTTKQAWRGVLRREPRCLSWDAGDYRELKAPAPIGENPPAIGESGMLRYLIGKEEDGSRQAVAENAAVLIVLGDEAKRLEEPTDELRRAFEASARPFHERGILAIGPVAAPRDLAPHSWHVPVRLGASPIGLWDRLAVKLTLNTMSTVTMARMGRLASNWMLYVEPTNKKLVDRGIRLIAELAHVDYNTACYALHETLEEQSSVVAPGRDRPSPVALTIDRLASRKKSD